MMAKLTLLFFVMHSEKCEKRKGRCEKMGKEVYLFFNKTSKLNHLKNITCYDTIG